MNEFSLFLYLNTMFFYLPLFDSVIDQATVNYGMTFLFLFYGGISRRHIRFNVDGYWYGSVLLVFGYVLLGMVYSIPYIDNGYPLRKSLVILASAAFFLFVVYPKVSVHYIRIAMRSAFLCGTAIICTAAFYSVNGTEFMTTNFLGEQVFSGYYASANIFVIIGLFFCFVLSLWWVSRGMFIKTISFLVMACFVIVVINNPIRVLYYFTVGAIVILFWISNNKIYWSFVFLLSTPLLFVLFDGVSSLWQIEYIIIKTLNESRVGFFYDLVSFVSPDDFIASGMGFAALQAWVDRFPYSPLDINSLFILYIEMGVWGVMLYMFMVLFFVRVLLLLKGRGVPKYMLVFFAVGLLFLLTPNIAPVAQTSVLEYYVIWFYIILYIKHKTLLNEICLSKGDNLIAGRISKFRIYKLETNALGYSL